LKLLRSNLLLISADTAAVSDLLAFLAILRMVDRYYYHHQTNYQIYLIWFA